MKALNIINPGPFTSVQDLGRFGFQQFGVPPCGMLDKWAGRLANVLAGNAKDAAVLEFTFMGATMTAMDEFVLAVAGADMGMTVNGTPCRNWAAHRVRPGDRIAMGAAASGCRAYMALSGGIDVPEIMGSRSTYVGAKIGGFSGRSLAAGDTLERGGKDGPDQLRALPEEWIPRYEDEIVLRAVPGPQDTYFDQETFFGARFTVTEKANRMGYRLRGPEVKRRAGMPKSIISEPSLPGGVQIPEDGQPIVLFAEQTVGGYAKIATVISSDLDRLAQAVPGTRIRFEPVTLSRAHEIYRERAKDFEALRRADLAIKTASAMGKDFFDHPVFRERMEKYLIQI